MHNRVFRRKMGKLPEFAIVPVTKRTHCRRLGDRRAATLVR
jgi:hypothetical protein